MSRKAGQFKTVDAQTFGSVMGQAVWLMTMSAGHRELPIRTVETLISPAILLQQFRLYSKGKQPLAFLIWARVSGEIKQRLADGGALHEPADWRSGDNLIVVDCISPFAPKEKFIERFFETLGSSKNGRTEGADNE